jgi:hemoglobin-like flavoprotein
MRQFASENNHQQPGDPKKLADALIQLASNAKPPLRLPLGQDALARIKAKHEYVEQEAEQWKWLSVSTDR